MSKKELEISESVQNQGFEFSRSVTIDSIPADRKVEKTIESTPEECELLAKRLDVKEISGFKAKIELFRSLKSGILTINSEFEAKIGQNCSISLESIVSDVKKTFETAFSGGKEVIDDESFEYDDIEDDFNSPISDGNIDIGELVTQYLSLEIDPYPKAEGAEDINEDDTSTDDEDKGNSDTHRPFSVLKDLINK